MKIATAACVCAFLLSANGQTPNKNKAAEQADTRQQQQSQETKPVVATQRKPPENIYQARQDTPNYAPQLGRYQLYLLGVSVVVSIGTALVVWRQVATLRQIERAWVMVDLAENVYIQGGMLVGELAYTNNGKTPAWVHGVWVGFDCHKVIPRKPDFTGVGEPVRAPHPLAVNGRFGNTIKLRGVQCEPGTTIVITGLLRYRDIFRKERRTCFGYYVMPDQKTLERLPSAYNDYSSSSSKLTPLC
jgi:hypothetical protein